MIMIAGSSALATARKQWRERNGSGRFCLDEAGNRVEYQSPPTWDLIDGPLPAGAQTNPNAEPNEYVSRSVLHRHVYDPTLVDPDA
jgi:hypothetical protein